MCAIEKTDQLEVYKQIFKAHHGILRASTAIKLGIPEHTIYHMIRDGEVIREARGLYRLADMQPLENPDLIQVSLLIPKGVVFLISALYFHGLTTQIPHRVYIALPQEIKRPRITHPPVMFFHLSRQQYLAGLEEHSMDGIAVKIYSQEKTITDCFKHRNQIGQEIALEALKDYMRGPAPNVQLLMEYARVNRVEKLIRPYVETLL